MELAVSQCNLHCFQSWLASTVDFSDPIAARYPMGGAARHQPTGTILSKLTATRLTY